MRTTKVPRTPPLSGFVSRSESLDAMLALQSGLLERKGYRRVADVDHVVVGKLLLGHRRAVHARAVGAVQVLDPEVAVDHQNPGVVARDLAIVDIGRIGGVATNHG